MYFHLAINLDIWRFALRLHLGGYRGWGAKARSYPHAKYAYLQGFRSRVRVEYQSPSL